MEPKALHRPPFGPNLNHISHDPFTYWPFQCYLSAVMSRMILHEISNRVCIHLQIISSYRNNHMKNAVWKVNENCVYGNSYYNTLLMKTDSMENSGQPDESSPHHHALSKIHFNIIFPPTSICQVVTSLLVFRLNFCIDFSSRYCMPDTSHTPWFDLHNKYVVSSTHYEAAHYANFSSLLLLSVTPSVSLG
jgi:hypothetical protein